LKALHGGRRLHGSHGRGSIVFRKSIGGGMDGEGKALGGSANLKEKG